MTPAARACSSGSRRVDLPARIVASPLAPPARFVWRLDGDELTSRLDLDDEPVDVAGVLVRGTPWVDPAGWAPADHAYMQAEMLAATLAWLTGLPCPVVNRPRRHSGTAARTSLLGWRPLLRRCGLPIPEQLLTNDPAQARAFERRLAADGVAGAIYAPLTGESGYLLATEAAWQGLADLQERVAGLPERAARRSTAGLHRRRHRSSGTTIRRPRPVRSSPACVGWPPRPVSTSSRSCIAPLRGGPRGGQRGSDAGARALHDRPPAPASSTR